MAWAFDKCNYRAEGELGRPIVLRCELDTEPCHYGEVFGIGVPG